MALLSKMPNKCNAAIAAVCITFSALLLASQPADAKNKRSNRARAEFMQATPCPATGEQKGKCPGYVIDHIIPLKRGGADLPDNMQWQTVEDAKQKDRWE